VLGWIRKMVRIKGNVSIREYHAGYTENAGNTLFVASALPRNDAVISLICLALRTQRSLREFKLIHYRIKLLLLNAFVK
jgi:hypothetical protein